MKFWLFSFTNPEDKISHFELIRIGRFAFFVINIDKRIKDEIAVDISTLQSNRGVKG